ncbi:MAG TPA: hypothetical protein PK079_22540 [Leptospiraceae bacterium]|nr:hypothetical protein [Leptospiraceae bacterium]HMZ67664.1 hypothetical protein [Leptospiraceae bacterium]HNA10422.1 hypothetical protein [Leptospiraceae bacterium]HNE55961.1 hypothetical protein [Leptospiraceae bacterium]HNF57477.1 hypothetical protein [Leptospiraceae bacterium]
MTEKFVVPFFNGASIQIVKDEKNKPVFFDREVAEEIIKPVRDLIKANDKRRG